MTLPTREHDGGIDWDKIGVDYWGFVIWVDTNGKVQKAQQKVFAQLVEALTIERCAKVADEVGAQEAGAYGNCQWSEMIAHNIRNLEP